VTAALYAYGIVASDDATPPTVEGVGPGPLELVRCGPVAAVAGPVDVAQFEGDALERNLASPGWLEAVVRRHEQVVEALLDPGPVLPMRFGSIFSGRDALGAMLEGNGAALTELLHALRGRVELGVTVRARVAPPDTGQAAARSGRDYLRRRQEELMASRQAADTSAALADGIHRALAAAAERAAVLASRRSDPDVVLTAAYLVRHESAADFCRNAEEVGRAHVPACAVEVTGPWPPYSFTSIDVSGPRG
jgi:hypothetical protein